MDGKIENTDIALAGLAPAFKDKDRRCVYLIDHTGNAYTFFKYKAKLIDLPSIMLSVTMGKTTKEEAIEEIRRGLVYGIKQGECVIFHIGDVTLDVDAFLKGTSFWNPLQLFRPPEKMDQEWYRANLMKPTDKDAFGN